MRKAIPGSGAEMRPAPLLVFLLAFWSSFCLITTVSAFQPVDHSSQTLDLRLPEFDVFGLQSEDVDRARELASLRVQDEFAGRWSVHLWNAQTGTPSALLGSGYETGMSLRTDGEAESAARTAFQSVGDALGIETLESLRLRRVVRVKGKVAVHFEQTYQGLEVVGGRANTVFLDTGRLFAMGSDYHSEISIDSRPGISERDAVAAAAASVESRGARAESFSVSEMDLSESRPERRPERQSARQSELVVLPVPTGPTAFEARLAWRVRVVTKDPLGDWITYVDAQTAQILSRTNDVHFADLQGQTQGDTEVGNYCYGETPDLPLPYMTVAVDGVGETTSDSAGQWSFPDAGDQPRSVSASFTGPYVDVQVDGEPRSLFEGVSTPGEPMAISWTDANSRQDERDVFYAVQQVHDLFEQFDPGWWRTNQPVSAFVNVQGCCNAYYHNGAIHFYPACQSCTNTGEVVDVVHHEYGHAVQHAILGTQGSQGLGEGNSDILSNIVIQESMLGRGLYYDCDEGVRDSDNYLSYPEDVLDQPIHSAGRVIAGFHWDAMQEFQNLLGTEAGTLKMASDWHFGRLLMQPMLQPYQALAMFIIDDDDGDLTNGTPFYEVYEAAGLNHGFVSPRISSGVEIQHDELWTSPVYVGRRVEAEIETSANSIVSAELHFRREGESAYTVLPLDAVGGTSFEAVFPDLNPGDTVEYYLRAEDDSGHERFHPPLGSLTPFDFDVAIYYDPMEAAGLWVVDPDGTDDAVQGAWRNGPPTWSPIQPGEDKTPNPGTRCWYTGQGPGGTYPDQGDIDDGTTTLQSPVFRVHGTSRLELKYWRSFSNDEGPNPGEDPWIVQVRNDDGPWIDVEHTFQSTNGWEPIVVDLLGLVDDPGDLRFRFIGQDTGGPSFVDCAVDDLTLLTEFTAAEVPETPNLPGSSGAPLVYALGSATPNPFAGQVEIEFSVPEKTVVDLSLFDVTGRRVENVTSGVFEPGTHRVLWDGRENARSPLASGIYYLRMEAGPFVATRSVTVL